MTERAPLRYFAACNSEDGFRSFYHRVFAEDLSHRYIIKGGPGTGKSTLMRRAARRAKERGYEVEEIYCSSDPHSLDGVILHRGSECIAILDGTAPHVTEMELPGARDEILYVGDFWSTAALKAQRHTLDARGREKAECYAVFYRYLRAAGQCERNMEAEIAPILDHTKIRDTVSRLLSHDPIGKGFSEKVMLTSSVGMRGRFRYGTFEGASDTVYAIRDFGGTAYRFFDELCRMARQRHMRTWASYDPLIPSHVDGICFPDTRICFVRADLPPCGEASKEKAVRRISMRRFVGSLGDASAEGIREARRCRDHMLLAACKTAERIRELHFSMETAYGAAMDFDTMEKYTDVWLARILP